MSQIPRPDGTGTVESRRGRRAASVTLRGEGAPGPEGRVQPVGDLMDPANKSLADALRIAYRLLQASILVMIGLFVISGVKEIGASERGARVTLGKIEAENLEPGWHWSWPQPVGDILKVQTNEQSVELRKAFFPALSEAEEKNLLEKGEQGLAEGGRDYLDPDTDGALLTADGYLVHTRWLVTYTRTRDSKSLKAIAIDPDSPERDSIEKQIVTGAVRSGVLHAVAGMTIDEVLYNQPDPSRKPGTFRTLSEGAKIEAQKMLDQIFKRFDPASTEAGIQIQIFSMKEKMPPRNLMAVFNAVQSAQATAGKARDEALSQARQKLTRAAGEGAGLILEQIDQYEKQLAASKAPDAARTLETIHDLMLRNPVKIDGKDVLANVSGDVSKTLSDALQYRTGVVTRAQGAAGSYVAKLAAFKSNPQVFLTGEWSDAYGTFMGQKTVTMMWLPPGLERLVVQINKDPAMDKMIEQELAAADAAAADEARLKARMMEQFNKSLQGVGSGGGQ